MTRGEGALRDTIRKRNVKKTKEDDSFDSVTEAVSKLGLHDSSYADIIEPPSGSGGAPNTTKFAVKRAIAIVGAVSRSKAGPYTSSYLGNSYYALFPRLLILWCFVLPMLLAKVFVFVFMAGFFVGGLWTGVAAVAIPGSSLLVYHTYRPMMAWAQDDYNFQVFWDWMSFFMSLFFNILVFVLRLFVEVWNGFCPFLALFVDLIYEIARQLVVIILNLPILQYFVFFLLRLLLYTIEVLLDCGMTILGALGEFMKEMTVGLAEVMIEQAREDLRRGERRLGPAADVYVPAGEILLHICVVFITLIAKTLTAFLVAFLPLISSFFQLVLPMIFKYMPPIIEVIVKLFSVLTGDPVRRIFWFLVSAIPIILRTMEAYACAIVPYLGSAACYVIYVLANVMSFVLKWFVRPIICSGFAFIAGCFRSWFYAAIGGDECYSCGAYNTACGCSKGTYPSNSHDCASTCIDPDAQVIPVPSPPQPSSRNRTYDSDTAGARFNAFASDPVNMEDQYRPYNSGPDDTKDIVTGRVSASLQTYGAQYEHCDRAIDPGCVGDGSTTTTTYGIANPNARRRRSAFGEPNVTAAQEILVYSTVSYSDLTGNVVSGHGVYTSSPGLYADLVIQFMSTYSIYRIGSLAYRDGNETIVCSGGVGCDPSSALAALGNIIKSTPFATGGVDSSVWKFSEWTPAMWIQVDLPVPALVNAVTVSWVYDGNYLMAPSAYNIITTYVNGTQTTRLATASCVAQDSNRVDVVAYNTSLGAVSTVRLEFNQSSSCSSINYYTGPFQIVYFRIVGFAQTSYNVSDLRTTASLRAHAAVRTTNALTWDPCATGHPQRVADGRREYPALFWSTGATPSVGIQLQLSNESGVPVDAWLSTVTVHLAATNHLPASSVRLCTSDVASWTSALTHASCVPATEPTSYDSLWSSAALSILGQYAAHTSTEKSNGWVDAPFWDANYVDRDPWPVRGGHLKFNVNNYTTNSTVVLWLGPTALNSTRATTWDLAMVETGMHVSYFTGAQWRLGVEAALGPDGRTANPALFHTIYCDQELETLVTGLDTIPAVNVSTYNSPFGSSSTTKKWVGITEIDFRGSIVARHTTGRRLMGDEQPKNPKVEDLDKHIRAHRRSAGLIPENHLYGVDKVMMTRGSSIYKHGTSDSAEGHKVRALQSRLAPDSGREHPFHSDLMLMPDPSNEPVFDCFNFTRDGQVRVKCHVRALAALNEPETHQETSYSTTVQNLFTDHGELGVKLRDTESAIAQRDFLRNIQSSRQLISSRRLLGAEAPFDPSSLNPWDAVKDNVMSAIHSALDAFEGALASAMQCGTYCIPAYFCSDSSSLAQCIPASIQFVAAKMLMCDSDQTLYDCTIGRLYRFVMDALRALLDAILQFMDLIGEGISHIIPGLGDAVKVIACWACALTTIATGVLADFIDDFPLSGCQQIVDIGTTQCSRWGMGTIGEAGSAIFENFMPMMSILFGIIQVLPALAESVLEFAILLFGNLFELFPMIIGDSYIIIMWVQSGAGVVGTLETFFEAMKPVIEQAIDQTTSVSSTNGWPSFTTNAVWDDPNAGSDDDEPVFITDSLGAGQCYQPTTAPTNCGRDPIDTSADGRTEFAANISARSTDFDQSADGEITEFDTGGCGCTIQRPACYDGSGTGNCPYSDSAANVNRQAVVSSVENQTLRGNPNDSSNWPYCADAKPQTVDLDTSSVYGTDSGELQKVLIHSKKCYIEFRNATASGKTFNDMALQSVISKNRNPGQPEPWWPFMTFSREDGNLTKETDSDYYRAQFPDRALNYPSIGETFRRRTASRRVLVDRQIMGVGYFYNDATPEETRHARDTVRRMLLESNSSYAHLQVKGIRDQLNMASHKIRASLMGSQLPSMEHVEKTGKFIMANTRRLLGLGLSESDFTDLACGFQSIDGSPPNTYPCAKHLWCAFAPPIPRAWQFEKEWISWKASWKEDTLCPELDSYSSAYLFAVRAVAKSVRTLAAKSINVWPFDEMIESFWSFATFPDDTWPQSKRHPPGYDVYYQLLCIVLNLGPFIAIVSILIALLLTSSVWTEMAICTAVIVSDVWRRYDEQELEIDRHQRERKDAMKYQSQL